MNNLKILIYLIIFLVTVIANSQENQSTYTYDKLNRLTKVQSSNGYSVEYTYDELGNRIAKNLNAVKLITPTAGLKLFYNQKYNITWNQSGISTVKLEYSTNNGLNWFVIIFAQPASTGSYQWTVPKIASKNYLVRISDLNNLSVSDQTSGTFEVAEYPELIITLEDKAGCWSFPLNLGTIDKDGKDITVRGGSGQYKVKWLQSRGMRDPNITNATLLKVTMPDDYTLTVTDLVTKTTASATLHVSVFKQPVITFKPGTVKFKTGEMIDLGSLITMSIGTPPYTFSWTNRAGWTSTSSNPEFSTLKAGTYKFYVTATDANGCASIEKSFSMTVYPKSGRVVIGDDDGINSFETDDISVYPNPAKAFVTVNGNFKEKVNSELRITNILGQELVNLSFEASSTFTEEVDISKWAAGVYTLQVIHGGNIFVQKVVKE